MRYATLRSNLTFIILCSLLFAGCGGDSGFVDFQLTLNTPEVKGKQVTVNGGVMAQVEKIQWEWGDGQIDKHRFFPASHTYATPGKYEIKVTAFDNQNRYATRSVTVEIK
jgi:PKD repeat protein